MRNFAISPIGKLIDATDPVPRMTTSRAIAKVFKKPRGVGGVHLSEQLIQFKESNSRER